MNQWINYSIEYANQRSYLDDLFRVYPTIPNGIRDINNDIWEEVEKSFNSQNNKELIKNLLRLEKFPIKDSYIAFLKLDSNSIDRNPKTVDRISGIIYEMGISKLWEKCSEPKETNTQIGPMFKRWIDKKSLGIKPVSEKEFLSNNENAILKGSDIELNNFARTHFGYQKQKGLDFLGRFNNKYIIGETKFITAIGGNQNNSFTDVISTLNSNVNDAICIGIIDGIPWIKDKSRYYEEITNSYSEYNIMSSLVLREFLNSI